MHWIGDAISRKVSLTLHSCFCSSFSHRKQNCSWVEDCNMIWISKARQRMALFLPRTFHRNLLRDFVEYGGNLGGNGNYVPPNDEDTSPAECSDVSDKDEGSAQDCGPWRMLCKDAHLAEVTLENSKKAETLQNINRSRCFCVREQFIFPPIYFWKKHFSHPNDHEFGQGVWPQRVKNEESINISEHDSVCLLSVIVPKSATATFEGWMSKMN